MSPDRLRLRFGRLLLLAPLALAACGFAPVEAPGGSGAALRGQVTVEAPDTAEGFSLRARLEDRLGGPGEGLTLAVRPEVQETPAAVSPEGAITRYALTGTAAWALARGGREVATGRASAFAGYSATGTTVATRAAALDARERLMVLLADEVVARLLLLPPATLGP